jgi:flagellar biosynthesis protein FliQ
VTSYEILDLSRDGVITLLKVAGPLMIVGLVVGVAISFLQALTQIQEMTISFVPKIIAMFAALIVALPFMGDSLAGYMTRIATRIASGS